MARKSPRLGTCCLGGCVGIFILAAVVFSIAYSLTGHYRVTVPPPPPLPVPNGFDDYAAAGQMLKANGGATGIYGTPPGRWPVPALERSVVHQNQPALARLRSAFGQPCRVPAMRHADDLAPYLADCRDLARLLSADADVRMARGDYAGAFSDGLDGVEMGQDIGRGGLLIHRLAGRAIREMSATAMENSLERLSAADCDRLTARMQRILLAEDPYVNMLREERALALSAISDQREIVSLLSSSAGQRTAPYGLRGLGSAAGAMSWHFLRDRMLREVETYLGAAIREAQRPLARQKPLPDPSPLASIVVPFLSGTQARFAVIDAHNRALLCTLAIRGYRLKHGRLPDSLGSLTLDPRLIADPFSEGPLVYKRQGRGYLLYSLGPDLKDDGGVPADEGNQGSPGDVGIRQFFGIRPGSRGVPLHYRRVPHMKPPRLPPGAPPLAP